MSKQLLIVMYCPSPNTREMAAAIERGACDSSVEGVVVRVLSPFDASPEDILMADAVILGTTENFGYMSGALKDFFDRIYYPCLDKSNGLPFALVVRAGNDGQGAVGSVQRITTGLRWNLVQEPMICRGEFDSSCIERCAELGLALALGLEAGIF